jgi:hypothetical protein
MLAEKFILFIEAMIKDRSYGVPIYSDGAPRVTSSSPHVPIVLPASGSKPGTSISSQGMWSQGFVTADVFRLERSRSCSRRNG